MTYVHATTAVRGAAPTRLPAWSGHLPADVAACRLEGATDERVVRELASDLVEAIGMRAHGEPLVAHLAQHAPEATGWSIVELIETSNTARASALGEGRFAPRTIKATLVERLT